MRLASIILALVLATGAGAQTPRLPVADLGFDQRLDQQAPLDAMFRDESGQAVRLGDFFTDRPVVLVLAYYRCPRLCSLVLSGVLESLRELTFDAGKEFDVVIVSFDAREQPELAAAKKQSHVEQYGRPGGGRGWHFLTGDAEPIQRLADAVGFRFRYDAKTDDFAHASGIMVLTPDGRVSRYLFGIDYPPRDLRLALVEAAANRIGSPGDQVLLFC